MRQPRRQVNEYRLVDEWVRQAAAWRRRGRSWAVTWAKTERGSMGDGANRRQLGVRYKRRQQGAVASSSWGPRARCRVS